MIMSGNKIRPSESEKNLGQGQDSDGNQTNTKEQWVAAVRYKPQQDGNATNLLRRVITHISSDKTEEWIRQNIKITKCLCYAESEVKDICHCGKEKNKHTSNVENEQNESDTEPTNAFGEIQFDDAGKLTAKFVRVDSKTTQLSTILELLTEKWKVEMPNLLISVAGGAKTFEESRLGDTCQSSLMKAVEGTGTWIITSGRQEGVMKYVGKAVHTDEHHITTIGITPWRTIYNKHTLVKGQGFRRANYPFDKGSLDPNHSHFILVDDGSQDRSHTTIYFRDELESAITKINGATDVPLVLLVLEWEPDISETVLNALKRNRPVVIVKASDGEAYSHQTDSAIPEDIAKNKLIQICEWNSGSGDFDIGLVILKALSKATMNSLWDNMTNAMYQLKLAFAWNRIDIAKKNISRDTIKRMVHSLEDFMMTAILMNRMEFVELMLDNDFDLQKFLTQNRLLELYKKISTTNVFKEILTKMRKARKEVLVGKTGTRDQNEKTFKLEEVEQLLHYLYGNSDLQFARYGNHGKEDKNHTTERKPADGSGQTKPDDDNSKLDLFIWSVLGNRQDMAKLFWRRGKDAMAAAVLADALLFAMSRQIDDKDFKDQCEKHRREFTNLAIGVLKECHEQNAKKAKDLLLQQSQWGETSCVLIAVNAKNKQFISEHACQDIFNNIWMGEIAEDNGSLYDNLKLLLCILIPPLILICVTFKEKEDGEQACADQGTPNNVQTKPDSRQPPSREKTNASVISQQTQETKSGRSKWQRIKLFYVAPVVIFFHNVISYMIFLGLYSYILISKFDRYLSWQEILLCVWVFTIFTQEIIQVCTTPSKDWASRFYNYIRDGWNILDIATLFLFLLGMILRIFDHPQISESAHIVLGVNLITFYLRLLHIFSVHRELGPKLVMIMHMVYNLAYFFMILLVFIVAYGIASHAILYPHTEPSLATLTEIFRRPYWNIYGELMLDTIDGSVDCTNDPELYKNGTYSRCPTESGKYFVPLLMGVYMLMCNILLLNLLIAMFSFTFQKVQDNSYLYWRFQQCSLINEYANRPFLAPPLIIFAHLGHLIRRVACCEIKCCDVNPAGQNVLLKPIQDCKKLRDWEDEMAKNFYKHVPEQHSSPGSEAGSPNLEKRIENMEQQLNWIVTTMRENNRGAKVEPVSHVTDIEV